MASKELTKLVDKLAAAAEGHEELAKKSASGGCYFNALMYKREADAYARASDMAYMALRAEVMRDNGMGENCATCQHFIEAPYANGQGVCMAYERGVDEAPVWVYETESGCSDWKEKE